MVICVDRGIEKRCWNLFDSYGEICVGCGCCAKDKRTRYESRLKRINGNIDDQMNFDRWIPGMEEIQKKSIMKNLKRFRRMRRYYLKKLKEVDRDE